jgi:multimeric flavodoxin WrbA
LGKFKILVIHGSMRKGNTYALTNEILNRLLAKQDVEILEFGVADLNLPFCGSCHACLLKGEGYCQHHNVMEKIQTALAECDGVIFSGVTYMRGLNAAMKNVIDHLSYLFHRPALFGKKGMVVVTSTGAGENGVAKYLKMILGFWGVNDAQIVTKKMRNHSAKPDGKLQLSKREMIKLDKATDRLYKLIKSKQHIAPSLKSIAIHNVFRAMSLSKYAESECDAAYWRKDGFYNKAYPVKAGLFKYLVGMFVHSFVKRLVKIIGWAYS